MSGVDRMDVIARWTVVKMLDGNWNVRDEQTGDWERDAVGLRKPTATKIADALNQHRGAVEDRDGLLRVLKTAAASLGDREPGVCNYLLNAHATFGGQ